MAAGIDGKANNGHIRKIRTRMKEDDGFVSAAGAVPAAALPTTLVGTGPPVPCGTCGFGSQALAQMRRCQQLHAWTEPTC